MELHNWFVVTSARTGPQHRYSSSNPTLNGTPLAASLLQTLHTAPEQHFQPRHERHLQNSTLSTFLKKKAQFKHFTSHHSVVIRSTCRKAYPVSSSPSSPIIPSCGRTPFSVSPRNSSLYWRLDAPNQLTSPYKESRFVVELFFWDRPTVNGQRWLEYAAYGIKSPR